jgi:leader peptidase (prepilin peptidase)/N-methyltransferase
MTAIVEPAVVVGEPRWGHRWQSTPARVATAVAAAAAVARFGATPRGVTMAFFVAVLVLLAVIDVEKRILPNAIVLPSALLVLVMKIAAQPDRAAEFVLAGLAAAGCLFVLFLINPAGMGMGDVKLMFLLGAGLGSKVVPAVLLASLAVWPFALVLLLRHGRRARKAAFAFGPFLAFGAIVVALAGG